MLPDYDDNSDNFSGKIKTADYKKHGPNLKGTEFDKSVFWAEQLKNNKETIKNYSIAYVKTDNVDNVVLPEPVVIYNKETGIPELEQPTNPKDALGQRKPRLSLIPPSFLVRIAVAFKEGAKKYGAFNWRKQKIGAMAYVDPMLRHLLAWADGEDIDPESGKHHLDGVGASLAILIDAMETGNLIDDRPPKGSTGELIRRLTEE